MTSQTDKLFREKLENFQKPVPTEAWNRIEAGMDKTTNKGLWMKIAAGLVLLAVAAFLLWPSTENSNADLLTNITTPKSEPKTESSKEINTIIPESSSVVTETKKTEIKSKNISGKKMKEVKQEEPVLIAHNNITEVVEENEIAVAIEITQPVVSEVTLVESTQASTSKTIVYTADEVNAKFLKKELPVEATLDEKKSSSLQKLMSVAYNIKNNETGLGDLRQKKDEILALNFRDKKQTQN